MKKIFLCLVVCLSVTTANAQDVATPQWSMQSARLQTLDYPEAFKEGSVFHIPVGQTVSASIILNLAQRALAEGETSEAAPKSCFYKINNSDVQEGVLTAKGDGAFEIFLMVPQVVGTYQFSVGLISGNLTQLEESVSVWDWPTVSAISSQYVYEGENVSLVINSQGASNGIWSIKWYADNQEIETNRDKTTYGFIAPAATSMTRKKYKVSWEYGYGDKKWFKGNLSYTVDVYPIPAYNFNVLVNGKSQVVSTLLPSDEVQIAVLLTKGSVNESSFTYEWKDGKSVVGTNSSYLYTAANGTSSSISKRIEVLVTNHLPGGKTRTSDVMSYEFSVQPSPAITNLVPTERVMFNPEASIALEVKPTHDLQDVEWSYEWNKAGTNQNNASPRYEISTDEVHNSSESETQNHTYELTVTCKGKSGSYNEGKLYSLPQKNFVYNIRVLPDPKLLGITLPSSFVEDDMGQTSSNRPITYTVSHQGGDPNGWKYEVTGDATFLRHDGDDVIVSFENNTLMKELKRFSILVINTISNNASEERRFQQDFEVMVYPTPTIEWTSNNLENYFYGSKVSWAVNVVGDNPGTWTYRWTLDGEEITMPYTIPDSYSDSYKHEVKVVATNTYKGEVWGTPSVIHRFVAWRPGQLTSIALDYEDGANIYEGTNFGLAAEVTGGYDKGWTFKWTRSEDKSVVDGQDIHVSANRLTNSASEIQNYKLTVENGIPGLDEKYSVNQTIQVTIWRKAEQIPSDFTITNQNSGKLVSFGIREGNTLVLNTSAAEYGYQGVWKYLWNDAQSNNSYTLVAPSLDNGSNQKAQLEKTIVLKVANYGPNGTAWEANEIKRNLTVYRKPQTPKGLIKKGNGSSRTLIATMDLNDSELQQNEYYLVFGCQQADGSISILGEPQRQQNPGQTRWSTQIPQEFYSMENKLCVYALWKYDDGVAVTSGLRFLNGAVNEVWDGSDYSGSTRVDGEDATGINAMSEDNADRQDIYEKYSIIGIPSKHLIKGLNIVRMSDGSVRKIIKK